MAAQTIFNERYRLDEQLASGEFSIVFKAFDTLNKAVVAVKVLRDKLPAESDALLRFVSGARTLRGLAHPNIVRVHDFGHDAGQHYLVMDYVVGRGLNQLLDAARARGETLHRARVMRTVLEIASALDYAHEHDVIHRHVKPSHIIVMPEGRAVLIDFSLGLRLSEGSRGTALGTPDYVAPEQAVSSERARPQSDQYSLAVIVYEMLTGRVPFAGVNPIDTALMHLSEPPTPPRAVNPALSKHVEAVVLKALDKSPLRRFPDCATFVQALGGAFAAG